MNRCSEYFRGIIQRKECSTETIKSIRRHGFFWLRASFTETIKNTYFLLCKITGTNFLLKVKVDEKTYNLSKEGGLVSIHLSFTLDYVCHHLPKETETEKIITIEKEE